MNTQQFGVKLFESDNRLMAVAERESNGKFKWINDLSPLLEDDTKVYPMNFTPVHPQFLPTTIGHIRNHLNSHIGKEVCMTDNSWAINVVTRQKSYEYIAGTCFSHPKKCRIVSDPYMDYVESSNTQMREFINVECEGKVYRMLNKWIEGDYYKNHL